MFVDAAALEEGAVIRSDVCLVGAGAAGITLALALARAGFAVSLLESGGLEPAADTQRLNEGRNVGLPYSPATSRLRYFGGTTNHWGGLCRRLDESDFLPRTWVEQSGWPIRRADLDPYYERALPILDLPATRRFADVERDTGLHPRLLGASNAAFEPLLWLKSPPTRMGKKYAPEIAGNDRIRCHLHANAVELVPSPDGSAVVRLTARTLGGRQLAFVAPRYVLAAGGIENARLLLLSDTVVPGGLGNREGLVGRYFMEHVAQVVGRMIVTRPETFQEEDVRRRSGRDLPGIWDLFFGFGTTRAVRERHRLLGCAVNALAADAAPDGSTAGVEDLVASPGGRTRPRAFTLGIQAERAPNPASRVYLDDARDALGLRKIVVDLRASPADARSAQKSMRLFALEVGRSGHGRVRLRAEPESNLLALAGHHMGTTRMADDPRRGVTDRDAKVHGIANLYAAGSSLFPTVGFANPTLTIVALALRLADHLNATRTP